MQSPGQPVPTLGAYIHEEYRRVWTRGALLKFLAALVLVEALRFAATYLALAGAGAQQTPDAGVVGRLGLSSWIAYSLRVLPQDVIGWDLPLTILREVLSGAALLAPYYAGKSIASARQQGCVQELRARGLSPGKILVGRGVAHLEPLLAAFAVEVGLAALNNLQPALDAASHAGPLPPEIWKVTALQLLAAEVLHPAGVLAGMATLVCVSALCRRVWIGVAAACLFALAEHALVLGQRQGGYTWMAVITTDFLLNDVVRPQLNILLRQLGVLALFLLPAYFVVRGSPPGPQSEPERSRADGLQPVVDEA